MDTRQTVQLMLHLIKEERRLNQKLFNTFFHKFTEIYDKRTNLFKGYRLLACDGSDINIVYNPNDEDTYFKNGAAKGFNQLHLNAMFDLLDRIYNDVIIQPARKENEHTYASEADLLNVALFG